MPSGLFGIVKPSSVHIAHSERCQAIAGIRKALGSKKTIGLHCGLVEGHEGSHATELDGPLWVGLLTWRNRDA